MGDRFSFLLPAHSDRRLSGSGEESVASSSHLHSKNSSTGKNDCQVKNIKKTKKYRKQEKNKKTKKTVDLGLTIGKNGHKISAIESKGCDEDG